VMMARPLNGAIALMTSVNDTLVAQMRGEVAPEMCPASGLGQETRGAPGMGPWVSPTATSRLLLVPVRANTVRAVSPWPAMIWAGLLRDTASMRWTQPRCGSRQSESVVLVTCVLHLAPVSAPDRQTKPLLPMCAAWSTGLSNWLEDQTPGPS